MSFSEGFYRNHAAPHVDRPIDLGRVLGRLSAFASSLTRRKQIRSLATLDDRMLADIGVTRADVQEAARWSLWGDPGGRLSALAEERVAARERTASALKPRQA